MSPRRAGLLGAGVLVLALAAGTFALVDDDGSPSDGVAPASAPSLATPAGDPASPSADGAGPDGAGSDAPAAGSPATAVPAPTPTSSTSAPSARGPNGVTEVLPQPALPGETGPGSLEDPAVPAEVDLSGLPTGTTTTKGVLAGWPQAALPVVAYSRVRSTSVAPGPGVVQLGLDAVTSVAPDAVLLRYREALARHGFTEQPSADPNAGSTIAFSRGADAVSVTVAEVPRGTSYAVFAVLRPAGD